MTLQLTRITSNNVISKGFRLRGTALEKVDGGSMFSGVAERIRVDSLAALADVIAELTPKQALTFGSVLTPGDHHIVTTKKNQKDGQNIARTRDFFGFGEDQEGILLLDYDPPKDGSPLSAKDLVDTLTAVCPVIGECETLVSASASSFIYKVDGTEMRGSKGWHVFVRVANAADIPAIGEAIAGHCWLSGLGRVELSSCGGKLLRNLVDESVWQPERLSFDGGADCGAGLLQRRPAPIHQTGRALTLADVELSDGQWDHVAALQDAARGIPPRGPSGGGGSKKGGRSRRKGRVEAVPAPIAQPLTPSVAARVMGALLHIRLEVDYDTHTSVGMGLKNSFGDAGFALWNSWSKPSIHYRGENALRAVWARFTRGGYTVKTVFHYARQQGWTGKPARVDIPLPTRALPADQHEPLATTVSVEDARKKTAAIFKRTIVDEAAPFTVTAAQISVGVGKTSALKKMFNDITRAGKTVVIVGKDKKQCESYEAAGAFWRHGRENTKEGFVNDWHCPKAESGGNVERLARQEHRLQQMCKSGHCEHGNAYMRDKAVDAGHEPDEKIVRFFREKPEFNDAEPCMWFAHMQDGQGQDIRVLTGAGLSQSDMVTSLGNDIDGLIVDEALQWSHSQFLGVGEIRKYIETLQTLQAREPECSDARDALDVPVAVFADLAKKMGEQAGTASAGEYQPIAFDIADISYRLKSAVDEQGVAVWEKPKWKHWLDLVDVPLRVLAAIKDGIEAGSLSLVDGQLHVTYLHPALAHARMRGIPILIMDATLDSTARAFASGIERIVAQPNVDWSIDPRWFLSAKNDTESLKKEMGKVLKLRGKMEAETGHQSYIICRKALALYMLAELEDMDEADLDFLPKNELWDLSIDARIGWFGWHDVAHDEWNGLNCILWGQMPVPDNVRMQEYADHRAALRLLGLGDDVPLPDNRWISAQEVVTGDHGQTAMARLPAQPEVREWLLRRVSDQKIQAAGRSRAVCQRRRMSVWQVGGYPMTGLAEHGIRPQYTRLVNGLSGNEVAVLRSAQRRQLITEAAALAVASGRQISKPVVREMTRTICNSLIAHGSSEGRTVRSRYIYIYQSRTVDAAQGLNENRDLQEVPFTEGGTWDHEYAEWRASAPAGIALHFARGAEKPMPMPTQAQAVQQDTAPACGIIRYSPESENIFKPDPDEAEPEEQEQITASGPETIDFTVVTDTQEDDTMMQAYMEYAATAQADDQPIIPLSTRDQHIADMLELGGDDEPVAWFKSELLLCADAAERQVLHGLIKEFSHD